MMKEYILRKARSSCSLDIIHKGVRVRLLFADGNALSGIPPRLYTDDEFKQEAIESSKYFADGVIVAAHGGGGGGSVSWSDVMGKPADLVRDASYQHTDNNYTNLEKQKLAGLLNLEVGVEKWYGTYTEDGVTYQVYCKIVKIDALPAAAGIASYPHGIQNIKQILGVYGFTSTQMVMNAPRQSLADNITIMQVQRGGNIQIEVGKDRSGVSAYVTIIYAKNN